MSSGTVWSLVERRAARAPQGLALLVGDKRLSNAEFAERALRVAGGLAERGIGKGDVVAVQLPNVPELLVTYAALSALGAVMQTVHMPYRRAELTALLGHSGARMLVGAARNQAEFPVVRDIVILESSYADLEQAAPARDLPAVSPADRFLLLYTSGTTDNPKGVPHAYAGFLANAHLSVREFDLGPEDILLSAAPLTHLYGLFVYHVALCAGAAMSLLPAFTPPDLAATIERHRASAVFAGPAHFKPMLDAGLLDKHDFASVKFVCLSGSAVPPLLAAAVEAKLPRGKTIQLWGMSELQAGSYSRPDDPVEVRHGGAGAASPGTELRVAEDGRLQVRGISVFAGYLDNPRASADAFTADGWFDTGDTGELDAGGHLRLTGRVKETINRGGVKYSPIDVEAILERVPGIARAAIVPYPDPVLGERACVFVQPAAGASVTLDAVTRALDAAGVAKFKWPERLEVLAALPLTPTQKVMRGKLRELLKT